MCVVSFPIVGDQLIVGKFCALTRIVRFIMNGANHALNGFAKDPFDNFGRGWESAHTQPSDFPDQGNTVIGNDVWRGYVMLNCPGFALAMEKVGWLSRTRDGILTIPRYERYLSRKARTRALTTRRVARHRQKKCNAQQEFAGHNPCNASSANIDIKSTQQTVSIECNGSATSDVAAQNARKIFEKVYQAKFRTAYPFARDDHENLALALERVYDDLELFERLAKDFVEDFDPFWEPYNLSRFTRYVK